MKSSLIKKRFYKQIQTNKLIKNQIITSLICLKKITTLLVLLTFFKGNTQCPVPTNLAYSTVNAQDVLLSWTENGTATTWDVAVVPDFYVGAPLPTDSYYVTESNSFTFTNFPPTGCNVFFVRSRCFATEEEVSQWVALATSGCDTDVYSYLGTLLSSNNFSFDYKIQLYPNPVSEKLFFDLKSNISIQKVQIFNFLGRKVTEQNNISDNISVSDLQEGSYIIKIFSDNGIQTEKIIVQK